MSFFDKIPFGFRRNQDPGNEKNSATTLQGQEARFEPHLCLDGPPDALVSISQKHYHYFAGNSYLGLQAHPRVLAATCEATLRYGTGTATTRLALTAPPVLNVERKVAEIFETQRAFYYVSGVLGPQILLETLLGTFDRIFVDEAVDHTILQALKSFHGKMSPLFFRHNDPDSLNLELRKKLNASERPIVLTNGVFSSSGKIAPLHRYAKILSEIDNAALLIDDSHGFGVLGKNGRGTFEHFGMNPTTINRTKQDDHVELQEEDFFAERFQQIEALEQRTDSLLKSEEQQPLPVEQNGCSLPVKLYYSTACTKAIGGTGGIIAGSELFIDRLMERSNTFAGTSSPPSPLAAGTAEGLVLTFSSDELRQKLMKNTLYFKKKMRELSLPVDSSPVPIVSLTLGTAANMKRIQQRLSEQGILIAYLPRHPGLSPDGVLRMAVFATHTPEMIDRLFEKLRILL